MRIQPVFTCYPSEQGHFATFEAPSIRTILVGDTVYISNYGIFIKNEGALIKENKAISIFEITRENRTYVFFHYLPVNGRYEDCRLSFWIEGFYTDSADFTKIRNHLDEIREIVRQEIRDAIGKHCKCTRPELLYIQKQRTMEGIKIPEVEFAIESLINDSDLYKSAICYSMENLDSKDYREIQNPYRSKEEDKNPDRNNQISFNPIDENVDNKGNEVVSLIDRPDLRVSESLNKKNIEFMEAWERVFQHVDQDIEQLKELIKHKDMVTLMERYSPGEQEHHIRMIQEMNEKCDKILSLNKQMKNLFLFLLGLLFIFFAIYFLLK